MGLSTTSRANDWNSGLRIKSVLLLLSCECMMYMAALCADTRAAFRSKGTLEFEDRKTTVHYDPAVVRSRPPCNCTNSNAHVTAIPFKSLTCSRSCDVAVFAMTWRAYLCYLVENKRCVSIKMFSGRNLRSSVTPKHFYVRLVA